MYTFNPIISAPDWLHFVEADERYSIYEDRDGIMWHIAHGPGRRVLVDLNDLDIPKLWDEWICQVGRYYAQAFADAIAAMLVDEDEFDNEWVFCSNSGCYGPTHEDDTTTLANGEVVCDGCLEDFWCCHECNMYHRHTTTTYEDVEVCESCRNMHYTYCDHCEAYRHDNSSGHDHYNQGCCESPQQEFEIRNGDDTLAQNERVRVTLPAGVISDEGIGAIATYLRDAAYQMEREANELYDYDVDDLAAGNEAAIALREVAAGLASSSWHVADAGTTVQTKGGNFTKRFSRMVYQRWAVKVPPNVLSQVGNLASDHSRSIDYHIEITRDLNQGAAAFAHEGSCWWTEYSEGRCAFKTNGGFGLRTFVEGYNGNYYVSGRAWVMPLRRRTPESMDLVPTFDSLNADAYVVFNPYGDLDGYKPARIVAHLTGMTYRKIEFDAEYMYVNSDTGYLVASEELAEHYTDGSLYLDIEQHDNLFYREVAEADRLAELARTNENEMETA